MSTTENAGILLPQDCAHLEQFVRAQAHIRAAAHIVDEISVIKPPHLSKEQQDSFRNLAAEARSTLWESYGNVQDLLSTYFIPLFGS